MAGEITFPQFLHVEGDAPQFNPEAAAIVVDDGVFRPGEEARPGLREGDEFKRHADTAGVDDEAAFVLFHHLDVRVPAKVEVSRVAFEHGFEFAGGSGRENLVGVGFGGAVRAEQGAVAGEGEGEAGLEGADKVEVGVGELAGVPVGNPMEVGGGGAVKREGVVIAHNARTAKGAQAGHDGAGLGAEGGGIAEEDDLIGLLAVEVGEDGLEGGEVGVDVGEAGEACGHRGMRGKLSRVILPAQVFGEGRALEGAGGEIAD